MISLDFDFLDTVGSSYFFISVTMALEDLIDIFLTANETTGTLGIIIKIIIATVEVPGKEDGMTVEWKRIIESIMKIEERLVLFMNFNFYK